MRRHALGKRINKIKEEIVALGPMRPGTMYERLNVCGRPGCKCGRENNPEKHGPYHYLSYTFQGRSHTEFVRAADVRKTKDAIKNYSRLMALVEELVETSIKLARLEKKEKK